MTHLTREDVHTAIATPGFRAPQVPTVVVPEGYLEAGKKAFGADAHVVESKRRADGYALRPTPFMQAPLSVVKPADPIAREDFNAR